VVSLTGPDSHVIRIEPGFGSIGVGLERCQGPYAMIGRGFATSEREAAWQAPASLFSAPDDLERVNEWFDGARDF